MGRLLSARTCRARPGRETDPTLDALSPRRTRVYLGELGAAATDRAFQPDGAHREWRTGRRTAPSRAGGVVTDLTHAAAPLTARCGSAPRPPAAAPRRRAAPELPWPSQSPPAAPATP